MGGFSLMIFLIGLVGVVSLNKVSAINQNLNMLYVNEMQGINAIKQANIELMKRGNAEKSMLLGQNLRECKKYAEAVLKASEEFNRQLRNFESSMSTDKEREKVQVIYQLWQQFEPIQKQVINFGSQEMVAEAIFAGRSGRLIIENIEKEMDSLTLLKNELAKTAYEKSIQQYKSINVLLFSVISISLITGIFAAINISSRIVKPITAITTAAASITGGNLAIDEIKVKTKDELRILADAFNKMVVSLRGIIKHVHDSAAQFASTAAEISLTAKHNSEGAYQVASSLHELSMGNIQQTTLIGNVAAEVEQFSSFIDNIALGAQKQTANINVTNERATVAAKDMQEVALRTEGLKRSVQHNYEIAKQGGTAVEKTINGLQSIQEATEKTSVKILDLGKQSEHIGTITEVIHDIAEQTNLLALNAAIEAARAGDRGRGFAVVADEVRNLAERSGAAAKEIAGIITTIQRGTVEAISAMEKGSHEVSQGVEIAREAGEALEEMVRIVEQSSVEINKIVEAVNKVSHNIQDVSEATNNIAAITRDNTLATEQMAAGSQQVNTAISSIFSIAKQNSKSTEEVTVSSQKMDENTAGMAASAQQLASMAEELRHIVEGFRV